MGVRGELFSNKVMLPNRTYFFNVKENRMGDLYLNIVESKNRDNGGFDRQSVILFADDLQEFLKGFEESLKVLEKAMREKRHTGKTHAKREEGREERGRKSERTRERGGERGGERSGERTRDRGERSGERRERGGERGGERTRERSGERRERGSERSSERTRERSGERTRERGGDRGRRNGQGANSGWKGNKRVVVKKRD
jgi:hypothetical protein